MEKIHKNIRVFMLSCIKHACFHVFSPFSAYFFPHDIIVEKGHGRDSKIGECQPIYQVVFSQGIWASVGGTNTTRTPHHTTYTHTPILNELREIKSSPVEFQPRCPLMETSNNLASQFPAIRDCHSVAPNKDMRLTLKPLSLPLLFLGLRSSPPCKLSISQPSPTCYPPNPTHPPIHP